MILLLHVTVALASIGYTTSLFMTPSESKLTISYLLIALTLISGTILVLSNPAQLVRACVVGLLYTIIVTCGVVASHSKLGRTITND